MKIITPPRWAERLIHASGAHPDFRDEVLGDLLEEFDIRAAFDGEREARRWYAMQALRTFPYLFRYWRSNMHSGDVRHISMAIFKAYCVAGVAFGLLGLSAMGALNALGLDFGGPTNPTGSPFHRIGLSGVVAIAVACSLVGGFAASRFGRRAPLASAAGLGMFWCALSTFSAVVTAVLNEPNQAPVAWLLGAPVLVMLGTITGGLLRVCSSEDAVPPLSD